MIVRLQSFKVKLQEVRLFCFLLGVIGFALPLSGQEESNPMCLPLTAQGMPTSSSSLNPSRSSLTIKEAILKNLLQQPAIKISLYNIDIQEGIAQSSAAPFDPVINSQFFHTESRDLLNVDQNTNALNLGQNLNPLNGIPNLLPFNMAAVVPTPKQIAANCPCPSDKTCGNQNPNVFVCPPAVHTNLKSYENVGHLDITKRFRQGARIAFTLDIDQYKNPIVCPKRLNVARMAIEIDQPLLRGREHSLDYMNELASRQEVYAVRYDTLQTISQQVLTTAIYYWNTLAARKFLVAQRESEERLNKIVENVKFLIQRGQLAPTDLLQPIAQLASQIVSRVGAEQNLYDAQQRLKFIMGEWDEICPCSEKDFDIEDEFPSTALDPLSFPSLFCSLFPAVFQWRFDIMASSVREGRFALLLKGAKNFELPQLDVVGRATFTDFTSCSKSENFFSALEFKHPQQDYTIGVVFSTPFFRDEAKGLIRQRQAEWAQAQAYTQYLKQSALASINAAIKDQIQLQQEVKKAKEAVEEYQQLIINENKKLVAGYSTIFIVLNFEASLTNAVLTYIQLQNQLANNIAQIRFLTGTLVQFLPSQDCRSFVVGDVITLPFPGHLSDQEGKKGGNCEG